MGPSPHHVVFACKTATLEPELQVSMGPRPHLFLFCIQNSDFSTRIASLYGSQPSSVVFACKTATFGSELQVSMGPRLRLLICECKTACLDPEWRLVYFWLMQPSSVSLVPRRFIAFKTATLAPELQVSIGPSPHLWFCAFTTATLWPELIESLWVPELTCRFVHAKQLD